MEKSAPIWCEDCRFVSFETGLGTPVLTLNDPNGLKNSTNVYSIHLELRMALPCQINAGKWKYVNPDLDFLGIPDQSTAYVKRQARPGWTYVRRSSVTPDLVIMCTHNTYIYIYIYILRRLLMRRAYFIRCQILKLTLIGALFFTPICWF